MRLVLFLALTLIPTTGATAQNWFTAVRSYAEIDAGRFVLVEDMDGDGDDDVVWASNDQVQIWFAFGGDLLPGPISATQLNGTYGLIPPVVGDVDGDGVKDLVFGIDDPFPAAKLAVLPGAVGGTFGPPIVVDLTGPTSIINGGIQALTLGQIDGDPALEIAESHDMSPGLQTLQRSDVTWWNWNGVAFVPSAPLTLTGPITAVFSMAAVDPDQNGVDDLLVAGTFKGGSPQYLLLPTLAGQPTAGTSFVPGGAGRLVVGDVDADGDRDAVAVHAAQSGALAVLTLFESGGGSLTVKQSTPIAIDQPGGWIPRAALGDWNSDGSLDAVVCHENASVLLNDGTGLFGLFGEMEIESVSAFFGPPAGVADVDVDGHPDLIGPRSILFGDGGAPAEAPLLGAGPISVGAGFVDAEGDGDVDYQLRMGVLQNDGTGVFTEVGFALPAAPAGFLLGDEGARGDFDGDGHDDALYALFQTVGPFNSVFVGMALLTGDSCGDLSYAGLVSAAADGKLEGALEGSVRGIDLDNDGDLDVPFAGVWRNDGLGASWTVLPLTGAEDVRTARDVDGDGDVDVLTRRVDPGGAALTLQRNQGGLVFAAADLVTGAASDAFGQARLVDLDDDGDTDVLGAGGTGTIAAHVIENQAGTFVTAPPLSAPSGTTDRTFASDVDGDGRTDVIGQRRHATVGGATWLQVHRRVTALLYEPPRSWNVLGISAFGDIDEDGDGDIFGSRLIRNRAHQPPSAGGVRQYGAGIAGSGGHAPVLGASGPVWPTSTGATLRVRRALAGAPAVLFIGLAAADLANVLPGGSFLVLPPLSQVPFVVPGPAGAPCGGELDLDFSAFIPALSGLSVFQQLVVIDPSAPGSLAASNGLEITFGF